VGRFGSDESVNANQRGRKASYETSVPYQAPTVHTRKVASLVSIETCPVCLSRSLITSTISLSARISGFNAN